MTRNQQHAAVIAEAILSGRLPEAQLLEDEWNLLLLAAGENSPCAPTEVVCYRVLENATQHRDYFARPTVSHTFYRNKLDETCEWFI